MTDKRSPPSSHTPLHLVRPYRSLRVPATHLQRLARTLYRNERLSLSNKISVIFCSDYLIRKLNARYRGIDRTTDVLSFTINDPDLLGEIYISLPRAEIQSRRYGVTYTQEVIRLFVHGFFHLLGYDHEKPADRRNMERKENRYVS